MERFEIHNGAVRIAGDRRGAGEPFVLVHGFTGSRVDWSDVIDELAAVADVIELDNRGHGESTNTGDGSSYSLDTLTADLAAVADGLGLDEFHLLGHSLGGGVAMRYALRHPDRLRSLVLMDTAATPMASGAATAWFEAGIELVRTNGLDALFQVIAPTMGEGERADQIRARVRTKYEQMDPAAFVGLGRELMTFESMLPALADLAVPTTVLVGEHDVGLRAGADALAETVPGAELVVIPDAAHSPQEESPARWLDAVRAHLEGVAHASSPGGGARGA
jgi:pimeloyl-ACP methyl ester carboxylesterase